MKYLGWILFFVVTGLGIVFYNTRYRILQTRYDQQVRETEMWIGKTEEMKRRSTLDETRQSMAPQVSLLLADVFPGADSFNLTKFARDTLASLANQVRATRGPISVSVFTDDSTISLYSKVKYPDAFSYAAARGAVVARYLVSQGVPAGRIELVAHGTARVVEGTPADLQVLSSRRVEIRVRTTG